MNWQCLYKWLEALLKISRFSRNRAVAVVGRVSYAFSCAGVFLLMVCVDDEHCIAAPTLEFDTLVLAIDSNEGCDVGDIDGDGQTDVVAGRMWFCNGDWTPRPVRLIDDKNGYTRSNGDFLVDVNQDGWLDVVSGDFFSPIVHWYENPKSRSLDRGLLWNRHELADTGSNTNEFSMIRDMDGDGRPEWITNSWIPKSPMVIWQLKPGDQEIQPWKLKGHMLSSKLRGVGQGHGMGFGDVNNDGQEDVLVGTGWYERPADDPWSRPWKFHADWNRKLSCPVVVLDVNNDNLADVIWGNPHDFGLYLWLGQGVDSSGKLAFDEELIDETYSQLHAVHLADLDGDGTQELITGKRVFAHNGKDPGGGQPPQLCYYKLGPTAGQFQRYVIDRGRVGIGLQIRTADLNADGKLDIVVAGKEGTQILLQR